MINKKKVTATVNSFPELERMSLAVCFPVQGWGWVNLQTYVMQILRLGRGVTVQFSVWESLESRSGTNAANANFNGNDRGKSRSLKLNLHIKHYLRHRKRYGRNTSFGQQIIIKLLLGLTLKVNSKYYISCIIWELLREDLKMIQWNLKPKLSAFSILNLEWKV